MKNTRMLLTAGIASAAVLLTGCTSMTGEITFDDQARADGELAISINKQAASFAGISSLDSLEQALREESATEGLAGSDGDVELTETDTDYVATVAFGDLPSDGDLWQARVSDEGEFIFAMENEGMGAEASFFDDADFGRVGITVNFPGEVLTYSGAGAEQLDADSVRWDFPFSTSTTMAATSTVDGAGAVTPLIALGGTGVAVLLGGAVWLGRRRSGATAYPRDAVDVPAPEAVR